jgi:hypothetical protein
MDIASKLGDSKFNKLCQSIYATEGYTASDLSKMLTQLQGNLDWQQYFQQHIFGNKALPKN